MSKRSLLFCLAAVLLTAALLGGALLSYYMGRGESFSLPPSLKPEPPNGSPGPAPEGLGLIPLTVDAENIHRLLAVIERPTAYSQTIRSTAYWPGGEKSAVYLWAQRDGVTRVETDGSNILITSDTVYMWTGNELPFYELARRNTDAESAAGLPTWEDCASLPPEDILDAEIFNSAPGERSLRVLARQKEYTVEYLISLENGLLLSAVYYGKNGETAYHVSAGEPVTGDPEDERFTLPNGSMIGPYP